jgi:hypothetical protein
MFCCRQVRREGLEDRNHPSGQRDPADRQGLGDQLYRRALPDWRGPRDIGDRQRARIALVALGADGAFWPAGPAGPIGPSGPAGPAGPAGPCAPATAGSPWSPLGRRGLVGLLDPWGLSYQPDLRDLADRQRQDHPLSPLKTSGSLRTSWTCWSWWTHGAREALRARGTDLALRVLPLRVLALAIFVCDDCGNRRAEECSK